MKARVVNVSVKASSMTHKAGWWAVLPLLASVLIISSMRPANAADTVGTSVATPPVLEKLEDSAEIVKPPIPPSKSELPDSAFKKLDVERKGYVTRDEVRELTGFDKVFDAVDVEHTGRLNEAEFRKAWEIYSGNKP